MRISEQIERLENKVRQLEKEIFELKAAKAEASGGPVSGLLEADAPKRNAPDAGDESGVPNRDTPASGDAKAAPKRGRPPKAKKGEE